MSAVSLGMQGRRVRRSTDDRDEAADIATVVLETFSEILCRTERDELGLDAVGPRHRPPGMLRVAGHEVRRRHVDV